MTESASRGTRRIIGLLLTIAALLLTTMAVPSPSAEAQAPGLLGDVNCDGIVNVVDAYVIASASVAVPVATPACGSPAQQAEALDLFGDVDGNGDINIIDAYIIATCSVGLPSPYCAALGQPVLLGPVSHDLIPGAIAIEPTADGTLVQGPTNGIATGGPGEEGLPCFYTDQGGSSVWYEFVATSSRVTIASANDDQHIGIFRAADGVVSPETALDLEDIACGEGERSVNAILQPGERYWVAISYYWDAPFWIFDRDASCFEFPPPGGGIGCPTLTNDDYLNPAHVDIEIGESVEIDDFNPGLTLPSDPAFPWSYADDEIPAIVGNCIVQAPKSGSVWYSFVAEGTSASVQGAPGQVIGFASGAANPPPFANVGQVFNFLACGDVSTQPSITTVPGERYWMVASGTTLGEPFVLHHN